MREVVLGIDIGTSSIKAALLEVATDKLLSKIARTTYDWQQLDGEQSQFPLYEMWKAIVAAVRQLGSNRFLNDVQGIGLSCLTPALVLLNKKDEPLLPVITHLDRRSRKTAKAINEEVGEEFLRTMGNRPLPGGISAVSFKDVSDRDASLLKQVHSYLHLNGWIAFHMTGHKYFDPANASFTGLFPLTRNNQWSDKWCEFFKIDPAWLPEVVCGSTTVGQLRPEVAMELGVKANVPVKLGTADTTSAMLSVRFKKNDLLHVVGTTQVLLKTVDEPAPKPCRLSRRLGIADAFVEVTHNPVSGAALEWIHKLCYSEQSSETFFTKTIFEASRHPTPVELFPPFLGGDRLEIEPAFAAFRNLSLGTQREDLLSALLFAMKKHHRLALEGLQQAQTFERVFITGGGATVVTSLLPEYQQMNMNGKLFTIEEGSLRGIAQLFNSPKAP